MATQDPKAALLQRVTEAHEELERALEPLDENEMQRPGVGTDWTAKDLLAHITYWEQRLLADLRLRLAGETPPDDDLPGESNEAWLYRVNDENYRRNRTRSLDAVRADFERSYKEVIATLEGLPATMFAPDGPLATQLDEPLDDYFANDLNAHYLQHAAEIEGWQAREEGTSA